jgi:alpha-galactosidase
MSIEGDGRDFNQAALQNQVMTAGLSRYVPFSTSGQMGATPYLFRSGFNAGIAFGEDVRSAAYPHDLLRQGIAEGKRIRKYFFGDFYPLTEVMTSPEDWCVPQYHRTA